MFDNNTFLLIILIVLVVILKIASHERRIEALEGKNQLPELDDDGEE